MAGCEGLLLLNLTRLGDLVQSTPLSVGLSRRHPENPVVVAAERSFLEAARLMDGVDEIIPVDYSSLRALSRKESGSAVEMVSEAEEILAPLLSRRFRMAVNLTHSHTSSFLMYLLDSRDKRGIQMNASGHRTIRHPWMQLMKNYALNKQITPFNLVDIYALSGDVPVHREPIPLSIRVPSEATAWAEEFLASELKGEGPVVAVQAGASDAHKMWHPSSFIRLCRMLRESAGARFVFLGGSREEEIVGRISRLVDSPESVVAAGKTTLPRLCGLLGKCDLLITNDTGPMHLAAAVGVPIISFAIGPVYYTNTGPYGEGHIVFQPCASCAPCSFAVKCVNPECKNLITPEAVATLALMRLRKEPIVPRGLPDAPAFAGCEIYLSSRGEDGLMDYLPVLRRPPTFRWHLERAYRRIWVDALLRGTDPPGSSLPVPGEGNGVFPVLRILESHARKGGDAASDVLGHSGNPGRHVPLLTERMKVIGASSKVIRELGLAVPEINGLSQMFAFEEENMPEVDLAGAARENVALFRNLLRRTRSLAYLLSEGASVARAGEEL